MDGVDLRGTLGKARKDKKSKSMRQRASHPYAMQIDDYGASPHMMDAEAADMIIEESAKGQGLSEAEQGALDEATEIVSSEPITSWADEME